MVICNSKTGDYYYIMLYFHQGRYVLFSTSIEQAVKRTLCALDDLTACGGMIDSRLSVRKLFLPCEPTVAELVDLGVARSCSQFPVLFPLLAVIALLFPTRMILVLCA